MAIRIIVTTFCFFVFGNLSAQKLDSIKYEHGHLYYHDYGKGEPIILLSGGPGNSSAQLAEMSQRLSKNYRIVLLEQRGTGRSIPEPLDSTTINLKVAISDIKLLLTKLKISKAIICGHSWGGTLAMYYASAYPQDIKSLVLIDPGFLSSDKRRLDTRFDHFYSRLSIDEKKHMDSLSLKAEKNNITQSEMRSLKYIIRSAYVAKRERLDTLYSKIDFPVNQYTQNQLFNAIIKSNIDFRNSLKSLKAPVSIITGRQDFFADISFDLKIAFPKYNLYIVEDCGHFPMYEQPKQFYSIFDVVMKNSK